MVGETQFIMATIGYCVSYSRVFEIIINVIVWVKKARKRKLFFFLPSPIPQIHICDCPIILF